MKFFLELYPPLKLKNGEKTRCVEVDYKEINVDWILREVLDEVNSNNKFEYRPEDLLVIINDRVVGMDCIVGNRQAVKIMLLAMGG
ncbi:hypothetical protein [Desulfoscipio geothermicus]|uniref:MoaD/ThiS family protein n=1 Tax=Desulfoscipio geothermicus DSM 3669 TaxID=1121426 RepID=A0A1I6DQU6_9FIRM|nr:hypothetical protein [Desulfoscipio geothermicus]SFR07804.1 hypothetical protein SAMN05660706_11541 [Desulfoscipio geothermicus DSM 3669]